MLSGPTGVGKTSIGRIFANAVLCEAPVNGNPCTKCESCKLFAEERHFAYKELDAASVGGKDAMVKLRDDAYFQSVYVKKIILIDECQDITRQGQDALLKQLEECPDHLIYIFCTTDPDQIKKTIRDRCMIFQISKVSDELLVQRLKHIADTEKLTYDPAVLGLIARRADGCVREAINSITSLSYMGDITEVNFNVIYRNYDEEVYNILANIGVDLNAAIGACRKASTFLSIGELYGLILSLLSDSAKYIYGYIGLSPSRIELVSRLKDIHGANILELLNHLISRDKYIDRAGLDSDIVLLHYKYGSLQPKSITVAKAETQTQLVALEPNMSQDQKETRQIVSHADLLKMSSSDRCKVLREQRDTFKMVKAENLEIVPSEWPLLKEKISGESNAENDELSPEQFSNRLIGGRRGEI